MTMTINSRETNSSKQVAPMPEDEAPKKKRIIEVPAPEQPVTFEEWRSTIRSNFPDLLFAAEASMAVIVQLLITDITNPFALVLVDVPSAGKTITINFFSEIEGLTYATDKFTPASFVSHASNVKKEKLKDIDLLPRLQYKMFLIRDLSTLFSKRDDDLNECLGILTRVLDGEGLNVDSGVHGQRQYVGEYLFMILAGSTPIPHRVWKMMGSLGSRLFFLTLNSPDKTEAQLAEQLASTAYKEKERACRAMTANYLQTLWRAYPNGVVWDKTGDKVEYRLIVSRCARLLAKLRGVINVWKNHYDEDTAYRFNPAVIEKPDRINQLFYNASRAHALMEGRTTIERADLKIIIELAVDSAPTTRARLFRKLLDNGGVMTTSKVEQALKCSKPTALQEMETLKILGVCHYVVDTSGNAGGQETIIQLNHDFDWFLSDECDEIRGSITKKELDTVSEMLNATTDKANQTLYDTNEAPQQAQLSLEEIADAIPVHFADPKKVSEKTKEEED